MEWRSRACLGMRLQTKHTICSSHSIYKKIKTDRYLLIVLTRERERSDILGLVFSGSVCYCISVSIHKRVCVCGYIIDSYILLVNITSGCDHFWIVKYAFVLFDIWPCRHRIQIICLNRVDFRNFRITI